MQKKQSANAFTAPFLGHIMLIRYIVVETYLSGKGEFYHEEHEEHEESRRLEIDLGSFMSLRALPGGGPLASGEK